MVPVRIMLIQDFMVRPCPQGCQGSFGGFGKMPVLFRIFLDFGIRLLQG